jgi:adenylate cyclase
MAVERPTRRLAAILSADIVGYSRLMAEDREATAALARECRATVASFVARHDGRVVDAVGDNVLAEFQTATAAARCAAALQEELAARAAREPAAARLQLRIGIDLGEVLVEEGRIYGDGVNVAARLQALAEPGAIYVSGPVREQIRATLKLRCEDLGERSVKNIPYPVHVHRVRGEVERGAAAPREARSLAVLPFVDLGGSASSEAFADGLAEEILNLLARLGEIKLAARTSSFYFKNQGADIREIAHRLGVRHVLEGSVRRDGERIRVTAQLIDGESGFHVWSETYDRELRGVFAIQDEISRHVVRELKGVLSRELEGRLASARPSSLEAYECVLQGRAYMHRPSDAATLENAVRLFSRAAELDPRYAPAHAGLCRAHLARFHATRSAEAFERARMAGERAIELDPSSAEARVALGALYLQSSRLEEALAALESAVAIDPFSADARQALAEVYARQNRSDDAIRAFHEAIDLQPGNWLAHQVLGGFLFSLGRFKEAEQEFQRVIDLTPDNAAAHANLGSVLYMAGDLERAAACWHAALQLSPSALTCTNLGSLYCLLGRFEEAAEVLERAVALAPEDHRPHGVLADALRQLPGRDSDARRLNQEAMRLAERALAIDPDDAETLGLLGHYCAEADDSARARELCARSLALAPLDTQRHYDAARVFARLGALDEAQTALERAVELGYPPRLAAADAAFAPLARGARFQRRMQG